MRLFVVRLGKIVSDGSKPPDSAAYSTNERFMSEHSPQPSSLRTIFLAAKEIRSPSLRREYLDRACGGDAELRRLVEKLLAGSEDSGAGHRLDGLADQLRSAVTERASADQTRDEADGDDDGKSEMPVDATEIVHSRVAGGLPAEIAVPEISGYEIVALLGEGGMGTVFLAEQTHPVRREVALKVIKPGMDSRQVLQRFELEKQTLATLSHPGITKIFDAGMTRLGHPYFAMELVKGVSIDRHCDAHGLDFRRRLELFGQACDAVGHAHLRGILHRDLKPANIMVAAVDTRTLVKVIDFGVAKLCEDGAVEKTRFTKLGHLVGTPLYMSPEQATRDVGEIDIRSDVYSLGGVLYRLLTGTEPFDRTKLDLHDIEEIRRVICNVTPRSPSDQIGVRHPDYSTVRGDLDRIVAKSLHKDRELRYQSVRELSDDLGRFLAGESVRASGAMIGYRIKRFAAKHRKAITGVAAFALLLMI